jgi:hypothetical protein
LCADRGERLAHFSREEHAEFADCGLPFLLSNNWLRGAGN